MANLRFLKHNLFPRRFVESTSFLPLLTLSAGNKVLPRELTLLWCSATVCVWQSRVWWKMLWLIFVDPPPLLALQDSEKLGIVNNRKIHCILQFKQWMCWIEFTICKIDEWNSIENEGMKWTFVNRFQRDWTSLREWEWEWKNLRWWWRRESEVLRSVCMIAGVSLVTHHNINGEGHVARWDWSGIVCKRLSRALWHGNKQG